MTKLAALMIMVIVGYAAVKFHVVESRESATISRLIVYILQPCLICRAYQIEITPERVSGFLCALVFGFATYIIWIILLRLVEKPLKLDEVDQCNLIFSNVGNLALPLIGMILGNEYVFYASALQIPFNLFVWTYGISFISGQKHLNFRKIILNPNVV
ncbi:MAG: AEC family transporter, partial [Oscillospiraceae bacterium]|nr:AEC family transporter [Oscillospiraceae bacterium]